MSALRTLVALLFTALPLAAAGQEPVVERGYEWTKLDALWGSTLGGEAPSADRFALLSGADAPPPTVTGPMPDFGLPFTGVVTGESAAGGGAATTQSFPVIPMSAEDAAVLSRRLAWAEIYLGRYRYYTPFSTDGAEVLAALTERQYAAALEAYLITARLYFSSPELTGKCQHLTRLGELAAGPLSGITDAALPAGWRPMLPIETAVATRLGDDALARLVCSVQPVRGRAETVRIVETRVREHVVREVRAKVQDTLTLLDQSAANFTALVNRMDVPIFTAQIMELERVLGNAAANMTLVKDDQLDAATTIANLQAVDLSSLAQPAALDEFKTGGERMQAMVALIEKVMSALAELPNAVDDPEVQAELAGCASLAGAYGALDHALDTQTLTLQINGPYEDCIAHARSVVARFQQPSLNKALMAELARHIRQISEVYLSSVTPP